jgi:hypothetical protein
MKKTKDQSMLPGIAKGKKAKQSMKARGVQTMIRVLNDNHIEFSNMSDNKANILISVNAIIISVILSVLIRRLEMEPHLTIPTFLFLLTALTTIVIAILATRPKVSTAEFTRADIENRKANLMFFGNFYKMPPEDFDWGMQEMMKDPEYLYGNMTKDIYHLGGVLARKFKLVSIAYTVFMIGLIVSVVAYAFAIMFAQSGSSGPTPV